MYWKRPKPLWMWPHWAKVIWSCIKYGNAKHKIYYNDNYFWSIFSHIFFRGRLHLKINCANNKLTCEGKRRLIKMSRSQLFLIVSCFVSNSQLHFSICPDSSFIPSIRIWSQYSSNPFHYHAGHPHRRSKKGLFLQYIIMW